MMKSYQTERVANQQASSRKNKTGVQHFVEESTDGWLVGTKEELDEAFGRKPEQNPDHPETLTTRFTFAGEDIKYVKVSVDDKVFSIAKSRAQYQINGDHVTVTMTRRYSASRPELMVD